ncbi:MAG: tyrosine-type recombinase/integrase [Oligoflexia bacterium]|nr:tyrosine-type recombinase/integrase [Oligoflexia bacterium]
MFCRQIGITEIKFHDLRATFITNALTQGVSLPQVMSIVDHARTSTTDEYLRLAGVNVKGATDQISYSLPLKDESNLVHLHSF